MECLKLPASTSALIEYIKYQHLDGEKTITEWMIYVCYELRKMRTKYKTPYTHNYRSLADLHLISHDHILIFVLL